MKQYFIHDGHNQQGPYNFDELKNLKLTRENMIWCEGMESWKPAGEIEELKSLLTAVPPPLPKTSNMPPPITPKSKPEFTVDKNKKKKLFYILIGAGAGTIVLAIILIILLVKSCNSVAGKDSLTTDSIAAQIESQGSGEQTIDKTTGKPADQNVAVSPEDKTALEAKKKEEEKKDAYRKNWRSYVYSRANYSTGPFGTMLNPTITVTNSLPYYVNEVTVTLNYLLATGTTWKTERVKFYDLKANSSATKNAPPTDRGSSIQTRISHISSNSLELYSN